MQGKIKLVCALEVHAKLAWLRRRVWGRTIHDWKRGPDVNLALIPVSSKREGLIRALPSVDSRLTG
jgi:hypothetical protein